jgi:hypothetical protein
LFWIYIATRQKGAGIIKDAIAFLCNKHIENCYLIEDGFMSKKRKSTHKQEKNGFREQKKNGFIYI